MPKYNLIEDIGDCEIQKLEFGFEKLTISIFDREKSINYKINLSSVTYVVFESNHLQNVIETIHMFENFEEALKFNSFLLFSSRFDISNQIIEEDRFLEIIYICPITGGEIVAFFSGLEVSID